jgi:hypothetical protein
METWLAMPPGRDLDAVVAQHFLGCAVRHYGNPLVDGGREDTIPCCGCDGAPHAALAHDRHDLWEPPMLGFFSTDVAEAFRLVDHWRARSDADLGFQLDSLGFRFDGERGLEWRCGFMDASGGKMDLYWGEDTDTAPHAICRAALATLGDPFYSPAATEAQE